MSVEPIRSTRVLLAEDADRSQVLVYLWSDGSVEISRRERDGDVWGPPLSIVSEERG